MKAFGFREYIRTIVVCSVGSCFLYTSGYFSSEGTGSGNGPQTQKLLWGSVPRMHWAIFGPQSLYRLPACASSPYKAGISVDFWSCRRGVCSIVPHLKLWI